MAFRQQVLRAICLMAFTLIFKLRPYLKEIKEISAETRRIAFLPSQLPNEVDVEALVKAAMMNNSIDMQEGGGGGGNKSSNGSKGSTMAQWYLMKPPSPSEAAMVATIATTLEAVLASTFTGSTRLECLPLTAFSRTSHFLSNKL
ncbi:hypothetical protein CEUSTIGMA_g4476.t1 [Chlamydomonas eustigma]|uniref:Uncharacterized protein n=1 Tax=Chlamydomonas eustigma TaxID=1157962 RepID=A0A250X267_9CHLO|nr:hypothetical protein CEUSTIGMA_g4476.t1 [Chlamydomonas eustigma]|eukprot:GAX77029.1 hypothetical protein CEUSTIGMA_g4476.t1 [Chlamydomonas eustigma]